jgi:oligopeptidase B
VLGVAPQAEDSLVYEEADPSFVVRCEATRDGSLLLIAAESAETSEARFVPAATPAAPPTLVRRRAPGVRYSVDSHAPSRSLLVRSRPASP